MGFKKKTILNNSIWNISAYFSYTLITALSAPIYIKYLGISDYGLLVLVSSILAPLGLFNFGFGQATIKYFSESIGRNDLIKGEKYVQTTLIFNLIVGLLGAIIIWLTSDYISHNVFNIESERQLLAKKALIWIGLGWLITQINATFKGVVAALQKYKILSIGTTFFSSINILLGLIVLFYGGDLLSVLKVRFYFSSFTIIFWFAISKNLVPKIKITPYFHKKEFNQSFNFGIWQTLTQIGSIINNHIDKFVLGIYISTDAVGLFNIPMIIFSVGYNIVTKIGEVLFPAISEMQGAGDDEKLIDTVKRSSWLLCILMVSIMGPLAIFSYDILRLYMGLEIANQSEHILKIFAISSIISAPSVGISQYLLGTGLTSWRAITTIVTGFLTLITCLLLVPKFGLIGAAWSDLIAILISRPLIHFIIWNRYLSKYISFHFFLIYFYSPSIIGLFITIIFVALKSLIIYHFGWVLLLTTFFLFFMIILILQIYIDSFLSESSLRKKDIKYIINQLKLKSKKAKLIK